MQVFRFIFVTLIVVTAFVQRGFAQINVQYLDSNSQWQVVPGFEVPPAPGSNISITDTAGLTYRVFTDTPASQAIGNLTLTSTGTLAPTLLIGTGFSTPNEEQPLAAGAQDINSITSFGGRPRLQASVVRNISGNVDFWHIVRLDAGSRISGDVIHYPQSATAPVPRLGVVEADFVGFGTNTTAKVTALRGDINVIRARRIIYSTIKAAEGSITLIQAGTSPNISPIEGIIASKNIEALNGSITSVIANSYIGRIQAAGFVPVTISARDGIDLVQANHSMTADITANANGGSGDLRALESFSSFYPNDPGGTADFFGTITARNGIGNPSIPGSTSIYIEGSFSGNIAMSGSLTDDIVVYGPMSATSTISIGESVTSGTDISIGALGAGNPTAGQIIVNANNDNSFWSTGSTASLSGVTLSGIPWYTNLPSTFGGGAIGEAPFNFHATNCTPPHNSTTPQGTFPTSAVIRHYGPVFSVGNTPVQVFARPTGTLTWIDRTNDFSYSISTSNNRRDLSISKKAGGIGWAAGHDSRVIPVTNLADTNALRCLDVEDKPAVRNYEYLFQVGN